MQNPDFMFGKKKKKKKAWFAKKFAFKNHVLKMKNFGFGKKEKKNAWFAKKIAFKNHVLGMKKLHF